MKTRYTAIETTGETIEKLVQENCQLFKADEASDAWKTYVDYVDTSLVEGFNKTILCSLKFLIECTEAAKAGSAPIPPLFEVLLELHTPEMVYVKSLDPESTDGFAALIDGVLNDIYKQASLIKRLAVHKGEMLSLF